MAPSFDLAVLPSSKRDTLLPALLAQVDVLTARVAALETEKAAFREPVAQP